MQQRLETVKARIREAALVCGRDPQTVGLVAVSKTKPVEMLKQALAAGVTVLGENYIQEARQKYAELSHLPVAWHFIGHLQSNKAKYAVRIFDLIHTVDSLKLAYELDKQARKIAKQQKILIQVNISGEQTKSGTTAGAVVELVKAICPLENVAIAGLMTMPPFFDQPEMARPYFKQLRELRDLIMSAVPLDNPLPELSMGMTGDFEAAIAEGATLVRIGTAIFGARNQQG